MQVSRTVPAKPAIAAPARVRATVRVAVNRAIPAVAPAAEDHSRGARGSRRATGAKLTPARAAPADQIAEYTPSMV